MSTAGTIFRESIEVVTSTGADSKTIVFHVENDGLILTVQRISGSASITGNINTELPDPMTSISLDTFVISDNDPHQFMNITGARVSISLSWDGATEFRISAKLASGSAIRAYWRQVLADDIITSQLAITSTPVLLVNASKRKTLAVKCWLDISSTQVLYIGSHGDITKDWPLTAREGLSLAIDENASVYLTADSGSIDTRVIQITGNAD